MTTQSSKLREGFEGAIMEGFSIPYPKRKEDIESWKRIGKPIIDKLLSLVRQRAKVWVGEDAKKLVDVTGKLEDNARRVSMKVDGYNQRAKEILKRMEKDTK